MRLFLAADLPKEIKDYVFALGSKVKEAKITWVSKKNLHITLKFLGEVHEKDLAKIKENIKVHHAPLQLSLGSIGFFPNNKEPTVIWLAINPEESVISLQQKIDGQLLTQFPGEQKFQAHLTLGRIKSIRRKDDFSSSIKSIVVEQKNFVISSYQLMKSELTKNGPHYETIENIVLSEM